MEKRVDTKLLGMLRKSAALLEGHFLLSSGLHSNRYIQCAKLTQYPANTEYVAKKLADFYRKEKIDVVIGGAFGGIIIAYEVARALGVRNIFAERIDGTFALRRGFEIQPNERVLIAEDVCTTGKSILEVKRLVEAHKGVVVGCATIIDRMEEAGARLGIRKEWLLSVEAKTFSADAIPEELKQTPAVKPGSRGAQ